VKNWSIKKKVLLLALLPATVIALVLGAYFIITQVTDLNQSLENRGFAIIRQLAPASEYGVFAGNRPVLNSLANTVLKESDVRSVSIRDREGTEIISAGMKANNYEPFKQNDKSISYRVSKNNDSYIFRAPIYQSLMAVEDFESEEIATSDKKKIIGWAYVELSLTQTKARQIKIITIGFLITLLMLIVSVLLARRIGSNISEPIVSLTDAVEMLERGHLETRVYTNSGAELKTLEFGINAMALALQSATENLQEQVDVATAELRETLIQLERKNEEIEQERKRALSANTAKSQFLANMSHELRTPLNAIIGYSEMLHEDAEKMKLEQFIPDLKQINVAGKHLLILINDILDLSKIEAGKVELYLETFTVKHMINDVINTIQPLADKNKNKISIKISDSIDTMHTDLTKLRQTLFNLLSNACKFTNRGVITLTVDSENKLAGNRIIFRLSDSGIGMEPEQMRRVFEAFSQADTTTTRKFGGTGLGLAISRRFCEMLGGDIQVESIPGTGTTFIVNLPINGPMQQTTDQDNEDLPSRQLADPTEARYSKEMDPHPNGERRQRVSTVLVIDDDPTVHDLMRRYLTNEGFKVETALGGEAGLAKAKAIRPTVITLDVLMPGMDGWTVLRELKDDPILSHIPVIMLTMVDDMSMGYALGVTDYITKPVDRELLLASIRNTVRIRSTLPILVVDDDIGSRRLLKRMLELENWKVNEASNGRMALEMIKEDRPALILLDLMMPEMDGFKFIDELRKLDKNKRIPVIVLTARDLSETEHRLLKDHVKGILQKGAFKRDELLHQLQELVILCLKKDASQEEDNA